MTGVLLFVSKGQSTGLVRPLFGYPYLKGGTNMHVTIEREDCISCGLCVATCPEVFRFGSDGRAQVSQPPHPDQEDVVRTCAENCPVSVIYISDRSKEEG